MVLRKVLVFFILMFLTFAEVVAANQSEFVVGVNRIENSINPLENIDFDSTLVNRQIFDNLYVFNELNGLTPSLVSSHAISSTGKKFVFTLKRNVFFSNGKQLTASLVKKSLERSIRYFGKELSWAVGDIEGVESFYNNKKAITGIKVIDDFKFEIRLKKPNSKFLQYLATPYLVISLKIGDEYIGSGKYKYEMKTNDTLKLALKKIKKASLSPRFILFKKSKNINYKLFDLVEVPFRFLQEKIVGGSLKKLKFLQTLILILNKNKESLDSSTKRCRFVEALKYEMMNFSKQLVSLEHGAPFKWNTQQPSKTMGKRKLNLNEKNIEIILSNFLGKPLTDLNKMIGTELKTKWEYNVKFKNKRLMNLISSVKSGEFDAAFLWFIPDFLDRGALLEPVLMTGSQYNFNNYSNKLVDELLFNAKYDYENSTSDESYDKILNIISKDCLVNYLGVQERVYYISNKWLLPEFSSIGISTLDMSKVKRIYFNKER